jgi:alpha-L-fucosidase
MTENKDDLATERFLPTECDFRMRNRNWFYSEYDVHTVKSVEELVSLYYYSVGNGANFLINIGPDRRGLLPDVDARRLLEFGKEIKRRFSQPIPSTWETTENGIDIKLDGERLINHVVLAEDLKDGESIRAFTLYIKSRIIYRPACVYIGAAVGHKRIITFPSIRATEVFVEVTKAEGNYRFLTPQVYYI